MTETHMYLGPFIHAPLRLVEKRKTIQGCPRCRQRVFGNLDQFCSRCGEKITDIESDPIRVPTIDKWKFSQEIKEALSIREIEPSMCVVMIPNIERDPPRDFWGAPEEEVVFTLGKNLSPDEEVAWFKNAFFREIEAAARTYDDVSVKWGLITYYC